MGSLNRDASGVVEAGRRALQPTTADRERLEAVLAARLGPNAFAPSAALPAPAHGATTVWRIVGGAALGGCVVAGALFFAPPSGPSAPRESTVGVRPTAASKGDDSPGATGPDLALGMEVTAPSVSASSALPAASSPLSAPRRADTLTREVALLSRAVTALNAGRASEALTALNEHQRQFPRGILGAERQAAKAQALCSLGRLAEGRAQLAQLSPQSPAANRARQVCDALADRPKHGDR